MLHLINVSTETLNTGRMIPSGTNSPPADFRPGDGPMVIKSRCLSQGNDQCHKITNSNKLRIFWEHETKRTVNCIYGCRTI